MKIKRWISVAVAVGSALVGGLTGATALDAANHAPLTRTHRSA